MTDWENLPGFLRTHYNEIALQRLAHEVGIALSPADTSGETLTADRLLVLAERQGKLPLVRLNIEHDYPGGLQKPLPVLLGDDAAAANAPEEQDAAFFAPPKLELQDDTQGAKPQSIAAASTKTLTVADIESLRREETGRAFSRQFRYVHGYTLPPHWARRDREMAELADAIRDNRHAILSLNAIGGTGKSALIRKLLDELPARGVALDGALWFSFYVEPEFDRFLTEACRYLIDGFNSAAHPSPYEKGVLLREAMARGRYLLVMDGIEVLLTAERERANFGGFQDRALREFLEGLSDGSRSQILISSRFPLTDLTDKPYYRAFLLGDLSVESSDELLQAQGVSGTPAERAPLYTRFGTHALTLQVLGDFLTRYYEGKPQNAAVVQEFAADAPQGIRLQATLDAYWQRLQPDERFFLTRMSAFRGGVDERSLVVLNRDGDHLTPEFREMTQRIVSSPLVTVERRDGHSRLTSHPLIKTFFYERMGDSERDLTHRALKDFAQDLPLPDRPRTIEDYQPLMEACHHCLQVGLYTEAYQIYRRNNMDNALRWWGHYSQAEALLEPLREASQGNPPLWQNERWQKSWVENETALVALLRGDTATALERLRHSAQMDAQVGDVLGESASLQNLAGVLTQRGDFAGALLALDQSRQLETNQGRHDKEDLLLGLEGVCRGEMGFLQDAFDLLTQASTVSRQKDNARALCYWTWRLADVCLRARKFQSALEYFLEASRLAQQNQFRDYEGHSLRGLGDTARMRNDFADARTRYADALRIARTLGNPFLENEVRLCLSRQAETEGNAAETVGQAQQALARAGESDYDTQAAEAHLLLARAARAAGDDAEFNAQFEAARELAGRTKHAVSLREIAGLQKTG